MLQWLGQVALQSRLAKEVQSIKEAIAASIESEYLYPFAACVELTTHLNSISSSPEQSTLLDYIRRLVTGPDLLDLLELQAIIPCTTAV